MKKIIIIAALFCSFSASAQYTYIAQRYEWLAGVFRALGLPAGPGPAAFQTSQRQQAGAVYYDSVGVDSGLYVYSGLAWRLYSAGGSQNLQSVTNIGNITTTDLIVGNTAQTPLVSLFNLDNAGAISLRATDSSFYSYLRQAGALTAPQYTFFPVGTGNDTLATLADVRAGGGGFTNPMTTAEDIIIGGVGGTPIRKGVGANGTVLGVSSGALNYLTGAPWSGLHGSTSVSASTTLTLTTQSVYVFTGSSPATYTLPDRAANAARTYFIKNAGTANITLTRAGSDELWTTTNVTSVTIAPGKSLATISLTSYWYVYFDNSDPNLIVDSLGVAGISPITTWNNTLYGRRISISGGSIDTTASGGLLITVTPSAGGITSLNTLTGATQTFATGTTGTDFGISSTGTTHTFNIPDASATARGLITTGTQTIAGIKTFTGNLFATGALITATSSANANLAVASGNSATAIATAPFLFGGATDVAYRLASRGSTNYTIPSNHAYTNWLMGEMAVTENASGASTHSVIAGAVLKPPVITNGGGNTTNATTLYIEGPPTGITPTNPVTSLWVASGTARFGNAGTALGSILLEGNTSGVATIQPAAAAGTPTFTLGTTTGTIAATLTATATLDFDLTAVNYQDLTITVTGATDGDAIMVGAPNGAVVADVTYFGWVSGANTVTVRCSRVGGGSAANPASGTFRASVIKY